MRRLFIFCLCLGFTQFMFAQEEIMTTAPNGYIQTGASMQIWQQELIFLNKPIIEVTFPVHVVMRMNNNLNLNMDVAYARADWNAKSIAGGSDAYIQANLMLWDSKLLLLGGIGIPTGKTHLNENELVVSQYLGLNVFRYRTPTFGQGLHVKAGACIAYPLTEQIVLGGGLTYLYRGKWVPLSSFQGVSIDDPYDPGDEINTQIGLDLKLTESMKIMIDALYTLYGEDKFQGLLIYQSGQKITINTSYFYRYDEHYIWFLLNYRSKNRNSISNGLTFSTEALNSNRPEMDASFIWKAFILQGGGVDILLDGRFYRENEAGLSWAKAIGGGFGGDYRISYSTIVNFYIKYLVGQRMSLDKRKWNIEGMDTAITIRYEF